MVWSHDPASGDWTLRPVTAVFISEYEGLIVEIDIHAADGTTDTITTTAEHPFLVASGEELRDRPAVSDWPSGETEAPVTGRWTEARHLRLGDTFVTRTGRSATVSGLTLRLERLRVYNLEVAGTHTYAVGQDGACVHNTCAGLHHFFMKAFGNPLRKGTKFLDAAAHTRLHTALNAFLRARNMLPVRGRSGAMIVEEFGNDAVFWTFDEFYRIYEGGKHYFDFMKETFTLRCRGLI